MSEPLTAIEAAAHLRLHPVTVRRLAKLNKIPHRKVGGALRFPSAEALDRWLAGEQDAPAQAPSVEPTGGDTCLPDAVKTASTTRDSLRQTEAAYNALLKPPTGNRLRNSKGA